MKNKIKRKLALYDFKKNCSLFCFSLRYSVQNLNKKVHPKFLLIMLVVFLNLTRMKKKVFFFLGRLRHFLYYQRIKKIIVTVFFLLGWSRHFLNYPRNKIYMVTLGFFPRMVEAFSLTILGIKKYMVTVCFSS